MGPGGHGTAEFATWFHGKRCDAMQLKLASPVLIAIATLICSMQMRPQAASWTKCPRLIEFSGEQSDPADVKLPDVSGRVLIYYWSELEPRQDRFDFSTMDREIAGWTCAGKLIVLRFSTAGWHKWKEPWSQQGTPDWAIRKYHIGTVTEKDGAVLPVYWSPGYIAGLSRFLRAVSVHLQTIPCHGKVAFVEVAVGDGGETKPDTEENKTQQQRAARLALWQKAGYTNGVWYATIARIIAAYKDAFPTIPLALMPDASFLGGDCTLPNTECREKAVIALGSKAGLILQDNGFDRSHIYSAEWHNGQPLACEQLRSATQQGYPLADDLSQSVKVGCGWLLVFRQDLERRDFQEQVRNFYSRCSQ